jgi:hypothetical protein
MRQMRFHHSAGFGEWIGRLGWLCLWLVARHSLRVWLAAPTTTGRESAHPTRCHDDMEHHGCDSEDVMRLPGRRTALKELQRKFGFEPDRVVAAKATPMALRLAPQGLVDVGQSVDDIAARHEERSF